MPGPCPRTGDTTVGAGGAVTGGRNVKQATIIVRDAATPYEARARATALFDQSSG